MVVTSGLAGPAAADAPATPVAASCSADRPVHTVLPTRAPLVDWSENLGVDGAGNLWVSRVYRNAVEKYDSNGQLVTSVPVTSPGAVRLGPDGLLYVTFGNSPFTGLTSQGGVVRFDPAASTPQPEVFISGLGQANGAAFDGDGNLYVADTSANSVERIRPDGSIDAAWTDSARTALSANGSGADGVVVAGRTLYVTLLESQTARVVALPIDDPARATVAVDLSPATLTPPLLPDDLAIGADGLLYIATGTGQLVRADPAAHTSCVLLSGEPLTSVVLSPTDNSVLILGTEFGDVLKTHITY
ncbi:hypothetical protein VMT65_09605 [Nocardia sp. CDC153]|uniref:SMP-30/gluconolactonase/LRE family protein n=1 Tax=Nocardia sp. CDC153 TaxID=3112167 RepID=UPI002DBFABDE|nr:hypothetical protein [Nocardia sp. CDC153]MEC3953283.1 hypothetical protein [Nocardia sp. CDC153]